MTGGRAAHRRLDPETTGRKPRKTAAITLDSSKARAAKEARHELAALEAQHGSIQREALAGSLSADALASFTDRLNLARLRAEANALEAEEERNELAAPQALTQTVAAFHEDSALGTDALTDAARELSDALAKFHAVNTERNRVVAAWVRKLRDLGVPDKGLSIGDDEIRIQSSATGGTTIHVGPATVQAISTVSPYIAHITYGDTQKARQRLNPEGLTGADGRDSHRKETVSVRLLKPLGGFNTGDILTDRTHSASVLAHLVHNDSAELIEGTISDPSPHKKTYFPVDSRPAALESGYTAPLTEQEAQDVENSVSRAFQR